MSTPKVEFYHALDSSDLSKLELELKNGFDVNTTDESGAPLLAAQGFFPGGAKACKLLIDNGADVDKKDRDGNTPLIHAIYNLNVWIACELISNGADVHAKDRFNRTALYCAACRGLDDVCASFLILAPM